MQKSQGRLILFLEFIFLATLFLRLLQMFLFSPMSTIFSDMGRHWYNGVHIASPNFEGGIDPKLFQVFIFFVSSLYEMLGNQHLVPQLAMGFLSVVMAWSYYRAARELFDKKIALIIGIIISLLPSLTLIFSFFLNETITLTMTAVALWMTLRARRKKDLDSFLIAVTALMLASFTRSVVTPISFVCILYLFHQQGWKLRPVLYGSLIALSMLTLASLHSYMGVKIWSPFGDLAVTKIYRKAGFREYSYTFAGIGKLKWGTDSYNYNVLAPIGHYDSYRKKGPYYGGYIDPKDRQQWDQRLAEVSATYKFSTFLADIGENALFFTFGRSWPDALVLSRYKVINILVEVNRSSRWIWPVIIPFIFFYFPFARVTGAHLLICSLSFMMILLVVFQQAGVMEGRYRKPLEPLFIITFYILARSLFSKDRQIPRVWQQVKTINLKKLLPP